MKIPIKKMAKPANVLVSLSSTKVETKKANGTIAMEKSTKRMA